MEDFLLYNYSVVSIGWIPSSQLVCILYIFPSLSLTSISTGDILIDDQFSIVEVCLNLI